MTGIAAQPNILFLFADDLGRYGSAYADKEHPSPNDIIKTPAFDRIAKEGAIFPRGKTNVTDFGAQVLLAIRWPGNV